MEALVKQPSLRRRPSSAGGPQCFVGSRGDEPGHVRTGVSTLNLQCMQEDREGKAPSRVTLGAGGSHQRRAYRRSNRWMQELAGSSNCHSCVAQTA
jgi:hypothetical protein